MLKKILICDDDIGILDMISIVLEDEFEVIAEQNSLNIYKQIEINNPDLIILDLWMPVLSGDSILKVLKKNPKTADIPVLVISASSDGRQISLDAGANDFLAKPFNLDQLHALVNARI